MDVLPGMRRLRIALASTVRWIYCTHPLLVVGKVINSPTVQVDSGPSQAELLRLPQARENCQPDPGVIRLTDHLAQFSLLFDGEKACCPARIVGNLTLAKGLFSITPFPIAHRNTCLRNSPSPNFVNTRISHSRLRFELGRGVVAECGVTTQPILEHFNVLKAVLCRLVPCAVLAMSDEFARERRQRRAFLSQGRGRRPLRLCVPLSTYQRYSTLSGIPSSLAICATGRPGSLTKRTAAVLHASV